MASVSAPNALHQIEALVGAKEPAKTPANEKAKAQAQEFESVFLSTVLAQMFSTLEEGEGPLGAHDTGGETWRSFLTDEYAKEVTKAGGIGLAEPVMREIIAMQEKSS